MTIRDALKKAAPALGLIADQPSQEAADLRPRRVRRPDGRHRADAGQLHRGPAGRERDPRPVHGVHPEPQLPRAGRCRPLELHRHPLGVAGALPADALASRLGIDLPTDRDYATAAGYVLSVLKHMPKEGEHFHDQGWRFEVVDMDGRRVDKVLASLLEREETPQAQQQEATLRKNSRKAGAQAK